MWATAVSDRPGDAAVALIESFAGLGPDHPDRPVARDRVIEAWLPLARHLARRYAGRGEPAEDLCQVATIGLIKAVDRYDAGRGVDFAAFAIPTVVGEIKRHFRDRTWSIRVPRRLQELHLAIGAANTELTHTLGRAPTVADVAAHLKISQDEVLEGLEGGRAYRATSLSAPVDDDGALELGDTLGAEDDAFELAGDLISLRPALADLDERERSILMLRFYGELSQAEIGERLGISQMHVSRLLARALAKLRTRMLGDVADPGHRIRRRGAGVVRP